MKNPQSHDLAFLPTDIFWMVLVSLKTSDIVRCRRVSRVWKEAFSDSTALLSYLKIKFPWTEEAQQPTNGSSLCGNLGMQLFDQVASRHHYLKRGKPRSIQKYQMEDDTIMKTHEWYPVRPWNSHASHRDRAVDRPFSEAFWTVEDNLLVYPSDQKRFLLLMDLETDRQFTVPFTLNGKVVRRLRLQKRVLVIEWADQKAFNDLKNTVHCHFASSFDVTKSEDDDWKISPRNEWQLMSSGRPLRSSDRFFSSHNNTHYVIYIWQRKPKDPSRALFVWDISQKSSYRPSSDSTGKLRDEAPDDSPSIISSFGLQELESFGIQHWAHLSIQKLDITDDCHSIEITQNICFIFDVQTPFEQDSTSLTMITSIPMTGNGPHVRRVGGLLPPYRGNFHAEILDAEDFMVQPWSSIIAEIHSKYGAWFTLYFRDPASATRTTYLAIDTPYFNVDFKNRDFTGSGKLAGCERYLVGQNNNQELVIYHFDR